MEAKAPQYFLCLTTLDSETAARQLARDLLQQKLVACVNISSRVNSLYHWQGKIVEDTEFLLTMKTNRQSLAGLKSKIVALHPYETPEFIVLEIVDGTSDYLTWIDNSLN